MVMGRLPIQMVTNMWGILVRGIWKDRVFIPLKKEIPTKDSGKMA